MNQFWEGMEGIWMRLGRIWASKIKAFASHGHFLNTLGVPCCLTLCYRNPRAASLRLAERHNARGSSLPLRVGYLVTRSPIILLLEGLRPFLRRLSVSRRRFYIAPCWDHFSRFFAFFRIFFASYIIMHFFIDFFRFFSIFHRFGEDFGRIFR